MNCEQKPHVRIVVGLQWGDEGKGAVVDRMCRSPRYDIVIRPAGGNNAGHRVRVEKQCFNLHQVPAGIIQGKWALLGSGMAINPIALVLQEINELNHARISVNLIRISDRASLLMPWHIEEDRLREESSSRSNRIGTTKWGIGQCYRDDADRIGLRALELKRTQTAFEEVVRKKLAEAISRLSALYPSHFSSERFEGLFPWKDLEVARLYLAPLVVDLPEFIRQAKENGDGIIVECAQGTMLDIRYGTYPYVTSSHPTLSGALDGSGLNPWDITDIVGIAKAYTTRVGLGPFPSRMVVETEKMVRERGAEFGTTTGRARDCGWLDLVQLRYACELNGVTGLVITKIDVLTGLDELLVCKAYRVGGKTIHHVPADLSQVEPIFESTKGWDEDLSDCDAFKDLPDSCQDYLRTIERFTGVPIIGISKGPDRSDFIDDDPFEKEQEKALRV